MRKKQEYDTTTNRSIYNKLHKELNASCSYCKWHSAGSENDSWDWYRLDWSHKEKPNHRYPNWKLVSKNKKQWMKKPLEFKKGRYEQWVTISWPMSIRPK